MGWSRRSRWHVAWPAATRWPVGSTATPRPTGSRTTRTAASTATCASSDPRSRASPGPDMTQDPNDKPSADRLDELAETAQPSLAAELVDFLKHNKKWWLLPILLVLGLFGALLVLAGSGAAPF